MKEIISRGIVVASLTLAIFAFAATASIMTSQTAEAVNEHTYCYTADKPPPIDCKKHTHEECKEVRDTLALEGFKCVKQD
jgi:hypothetical protein